MLTGSELLAKVKELGQAPRDQIAIACGYARKDGKPDYISFFEALNAAHGLPLTPATVTRKPRAGKPLSWNVAVAKSGMIPISAGYSNLLGLAAGDRVEIKHDGDSIVLSKSTAPVVVTEAPEVVSESDEIVITAPAKRELVAA